MKSLALILTLAGSASGQTCGLSCGDCDGDGAVTIVDALQAARWANGEVIDGYSIAALACDVAEPTAPGCWGPAYITILDALTIAQYVTGHPVTLCCP